MLQSPILRRLYNNLQQSNPASEEAPKNFAPKVMEEYIKQVSANVPQRNATPEIVQLPAFQQPVQPGMGAPQPTIADPQPEPPPVEVGPSPTKEAPKPVEEQSYVVQTSPDANFASGPGEGFAKGPVKDWMKKPMQVTAGGYNNYGSSVNTVNTASGYSPNIGPRYS